MGLIQIYTGTPGSGKSLHMAKDIFLISSRRKKCIIICNFEVDTKKLKNPDRFIYIANGELSPEILMKISEEFFVGNNLPLEENRIYLLIDECQLLFNSRDWRDEARKGWLSFFSQHRKYGFSVTLCCQYDLMIDKQIRALIEYEVIHRKITNFGSAGIVLRLLAFGDIFIAVEKWYSLSQKIGSSYFRFHQKYASLYDTFNRFDSRKPKLPQDSPLEAAAD